VGHPDGLMRRRLAAPLSKAQPTEDCTIAHDLPSAVRRPPKAVHPFLSGSKCRVHTRRGCATFVRDATPRIPMDRESGSAEKVRPAAAARCNAYVLVSSMHRWHDEGESA
jgi:hypothetical protein